MAGAMARAVLAGCLAALIALGPHLACAQAAGQAQADRDALIRGLEAQFQVALIRDRKMADDRESALIDQAEARLKAARAAADAATGDAKKANAELADARAAYASLAESITQHDAEAQAAIAAYKAEAENLAAGATPDKLAALQRFADGDRVGAWPVIEALTDAEDTAIEAAANVRRAAGQRQLASLREVMRDHGEATAADVLALWDKAAALDPSDFQTHIEQVRLEILLGDLASAKKDADLALTAAGTDEQRAVADNDEAQIADSQGDHAGARQASEDGVAILRKLTAADPKSAPLQQDLADSLETLGVTLGAQGDHAGGRKDLQEALGVRRALLAASPNDAVLKADLADCLEALGDQTNFPGDLPDARQELEEALSIRQALAAADATSTDQQLELAELQRRIGDIQVAQGDNAGALATYQASLVTARKLVMADPSSAKFRGNVAAYLRRIGDVQRTLGDFADAQASYDEGLSIWKNLAAADPTSADKQTYVVGFQMRIGDLLAAEGDAADQKGDHAGAQADYTNARGYYDQGLVIRQKLSAADPTNMDMAYYTSGLLRRIGDLVFRQGQLAEQQGDQAAAKADFDTALADYRQCLAIRLKMVAADPGSPDKQVAVSIDYVNLGDVARAEGDLESALADYKKGLAIRQKLTAADPSNALMRSLLAELMDRMAALPGSSVTWTQVVAQFSAIKAAGHLEPADAKLLADAETRAAGKPPS